MKWLFAILKNKLIVYIMAIVSSVPLINMGAYYSVPLFLHPLTVTLWLTWTICTTSKCDALLTWNVLHDTGRKYWVNVVPSVVFAGRVFFAIQVYLEDTRF